MSGRALAEQIARDLFTNGARRRADRLVLQEDSDYLGAWSEEALADRIEEALTGLNPLQHELLDLITLMPDSQTQEIVDYIMQLRDIRGRRDRPMYPDLPGGENHDQQFGKMPACVHLYEEGGTMCLRCGAVRTEGGAR